MGDHHGSLSTDTGHPDSGYPLGWESLPEVRRACVRYGRAAAPRWLSSAAPPGPILDRYLSSSSALSQTKGVHEDRECHSVGCSWALEGERPGQDGSAV